MNPTSSPGRNPLSKPPSVGLVAWLFLLMTLGHSVIAVAKHRSQQASPRTARLWISAVKNNQPVGNLKKKDLQLWIGKKEETISSLALAPQGPFVLGLLIDASGSRREGWPGPGIALAPSFLQRVLQPGDSAFLVGFSDDVRLLAGPTADLASLEQELAGIRYVTPRGGTALYDAIVASCKLLNRTRGSARHALVMVTDAEDDASWNNHKEAIRAAVATGTVLYVLDTKPGNLHGDFLGRSQVEVVMSNATRETGGLLLPAGGKSEMASALDTVGLALRNRYALDFQVTGTIKPNSPIKVTCVHSDVQIIAPARY